MNFRCSFAVSLFDHLAPDIKKPPGNRAVRGFCTTFPWPPLASPPPGNCCAMNFHGGFLTSTRATGKPSVYWFLMLGPEEFAATVALQTLRDSPSPRAVAIPYCSRVERLLFATYANGRCSMACTMHAYDTIIIMQAFNKRLTINPATNWG